MTITEVVAALNAQGGSAWVYAGPLAGGFSRGAHLLEGPDGARAVLKHHDRAAQHDIRVTARLVDDMRRAGWPTARWLSCGSLDDGSPYVVTEFVAGAVPIAIGRAELDELLTIVARQAARHPATDRDHAGYVTDGVLEDRFDWRKTLAARPDTRPLVERIGTYLAGTRRVELTRDDVVHGDLTPYNIVVSDGRMVLIDTDFAGKGSRGIDLATLLVTLGTDEHLTADPGVLARLYDECATVLDPAALRACVAYRMLGVAEFGVRHQIGDPARYSARCVAFLDRLVKIETRRRYGAHDPSRRTAYREAPVRSATQHPPGSGSRSARRPRTPRWSTKPLMSL